MVICDTNGNWVISAAALVKPGPAPNCKLKYVSKVLMVGLHDTCSSCVTETKESIAKERKKGTK